jgi:hypothetical protein
MPLVKMSKNNKVKDIERFETDKAEGLDKSNPYLTRTILLVSENPFAASL